MTERSSHSKTRKLNCVNVCDPNLTVEVSIWVHHRKNIPAIDFIQCSSIILQDLQWIPVQFLRQVRVCLVVLYELTGLEEKNKFDERSCCKVEPPDHEGGDSGPDPLVGVDPPVEPHRRSIPTPTLPLANLACFVRQTWQRMLFTLFIPTHTVLPSLSIERQKVTEWMRKFAGCDETLRTRMSCPSKDFPINSVETQS